MDAQNNIDLLLPTAQRQVKILRACAPLSVPCKQRELMIAAEAADDSAGQAAGGVFPIDRELTKRAQVQLARQQRGPCMPHLAHVASTERRHTVRW